MGEGTWRFSCSEIPNVLKLLKEQEVKHGTGCCLGLDPPLTPDIIALVTRNDTNRGH